MSTSCSWTCSSPARCRAPRRPAASARRPGAPRVLVLTNYDTDADILGAIEAGASGYLLKDAPPAELIAAVRASAVGESALAPGISSRLDASLHHERAPDVPRGGGALARRRGTHEPRDRPRALPQRGDSEVAPRAHLREAAGRLTHGRGRAGPANSARSGRADGCPALASSSCTGCAPRRRCGAGSSSSSRATTSRRSRSTCPGTACGSGEPFSVDAAIEAIDEALLTFRRPRATRRLRRRRSTARRAQPRRLPRDRVRGAAPTASTGWSRRRAAPGRAGSASPATGGWPRSSAACPTRDAA